MTLAAGSRRAHAIDSLRRQIGRGNFTDAEVKRWSDELGADVVGALVREHTPKKPVTKAAAKANK